MSQILGHLFYLLKTTSFSVKLKLGCLMIRFFGVKKTAAFGRQLGIKNALLLHHFPAFFLGSIVVFQQIDTAWHAF